MQRASQPAVLLWSVAGTLVGSLLLIPAVIYLFRVFKLKTFEPVAVGRSDQ